MVLDRPFGLQEMKPRISRQSVQEGQPYTPATFTPQETTLVLSCNRLKDYVNKTFE